MTCNHKRSGIISNQTGAYDRTRPHAAANVCDRPACIAAVAQWVYGKTGEPVFYRADADKSRWISIDEVTR